MTNEFLSVRINQLRGPMKERPPWNVPEIQPRRGSRSWRRATWRWSRRRKWVGWCLRARARGSNSTGRLIRISSRASSHMADGTAGHLFFFFHSQYKHIVKNVLIAEKRWKGTVVAKTCLGRHYYIIIVAAVVTFPKLTNWVGNETKTKKKKSQGSPFDAINPCSFFMAYYAACGRQWREKKIPTP